MSLGMANAGMKMQGRVGTLDFGNRVAEANRKHFNSDDEYWDAWFSDDPDDWPDFDDTDAVVGCPPCSAACWWHWRALAQAWPGLRATC